MRPAIDRVVLLVLCGCVLSFARPVSAGEPDMRQIQPFVMLIADTSGSMEWLPGCVCTTDGCTECLPDCSLANDSNKVAPPKKKNRWSVLLEALTGQFIDFQCKPLPRTDASQFTYDFGYPKPFNRPWVCPNGSTYCTYPGTDTAPIQLQNGLLDNYSGRLQFGLATFDGMRTYVGAGDLVTANNFNQALSDQAEGSWSYGGAKPVRYPTCGEDHLIDSGIRSAKAPEGGLITLNSPLCATPPCDPLIINTAIQNSLLSARTYGGTPTAAALDDLYYHFKNEYKDTFYKCRPRYAVLISDGYPDDDFREYPVPGCDCGARGNCGDENPADMKCPYPTAVQAAYDLKHGRTSATSTDDPMIEQLFVVGMSINDNKARVSLNAIASAGGSVDDDKDGNEAYFATDPTALTAYMDTLLGNVAKPISRSIPAFATGQSQTQYQIDTGFSISTITVPPGFTPPWKGILERRRFLCNGAVLSSPTLEDQDRFEVLLNKQTARSLWTALPTAPTHALAEGKLDRIDSGTACGATGCARTELTAVPTALFGSIDAARRTVLLDWMYGNTGSVRANMKLGDIYHSSPTVVGLPTEDPGDQSYSLFTQSLAIQNRPAVVYVNSNDGILHAFVLEDQPLSVPGARKGGEELWGFVPPILLDDLNPQLSAHRSNLDATPVVKDVYFSKGATPLPTDYKTVLVTGMRSGGNAYMALDVTDPVNPKFMWQFTDPDMGQTYGLPEIVQARYSWPPGQPATLRAMAILSGGKGAKSTTGPGCDSTKNTVLALRVPGGGNAVFTTRADADLTAASIPHRADIQCWGQQGRALFFVDVETGKLIKKIFDNDNNLTNGTIFASPLIGTPTAYQDTTGTIATEGFVLDADGVLWRIDLNATDPLPNDALNGWTVRPFHDVFWDMKPNEGETTYERPILSLDEKHQLVVLVGTGDTDNFEKPTILNRVVSLTEMTITATPTKPSDYIAGLNWELRGEDSDIGPNFVRSELVTGSMALFDEQLYIASFIPVSSTTDACAMGLGRLWAVNFHDRDKTNPNTQYGSGNTGAVLTYEPVRLTLGSTDTSGSNADLGLFNVRKSSAEPNLLIQGLGSTQRLTCNDNLSQVGNYFASGTTNPMLKQTTTPSIWIVAQASSGNAQRNRAGSKLGSVEVKINRPLEFSQVSSWAGSIE